MQVEDRASDGQSPREPPWCTSSAWTHFMKRPRMSSQNNYVWTAEDWHIVKDLGFVPGRRVSIWFDDVDDGSMCPGTVFSVEDGMVWIRFDADQELNGFTAKELIQEEEEDSAARHHPNYIVHDEYDPRSVSKKYLVQPPASAPASSPASAPASAPAPAPASAASVHLDETDDEDDVGVNNPNKTHFLNVVIGVLPYPPDNNSIWYVTCRHCYRNGSPIVSCMMPLYNSRFMDLSTRFERHYRNNHKGLPYKIHGKPVLMTSDKLNTFVGCVPSYKGLFTKYLGKWIDGAPSGAGRSPPVQDNVGAGVVQGAIPIINHILVPSSAAAAVDALMNLRSRDDDEGDIRKLEPPPSMQALDPEHQDCVFSMNGRPSNFMQHGQSSKGTSERFMQRGQSPPPPTPKESEQSPPVAKKKKTPRVLHITWTCLTCTFINEVKSAKCSMCEVSRPVIEIL